MNLKFFLRLFGGITVMLTLMPLIAVDYWWIRLFDFPHVQLSLLTLASALFYLIRFDIKNLKDYIFLLVLLACFAYQVAKIYPYTPIAKEEVLSSSTGKEIQHFTIYAANVLQSNKQKSKLTNNIHSTDADILLFTETNKEWKTEIEKATKENYEFGIGVPLENTYGMMLHSKFRLINPQVKFLVDDSIPSIHSLLQLPSGDTIQLFAIHPTPPMPQHNDTSTDRDAEMMKIALLSLESNYPVLVLGDFNDVAWSISTMDFQNVSGLLDPRKGRGLFNTYHADYFFLRWPLDHIFFSEHFRLSKLERKESIGSDHFPIYVNLSYEPENADEQKVQAPSKKQIEKAYKQIQKEEQEE